MISRRNIRVKVMQTLYTVSASDTDAHPGKALEILNQHFEQTRSLLVYLIYFLTEVARYAETDARLRAAKHLPTEEDLHVNTKIAGNEILLKILKEPTLQEQFLKYKPEVTIDRELVKKIYHNLTEKGEYKQYISQPDRNPAGERNILEFILNDLMLSEDLFLAHIEDTYSNWYDDAELVIQLLASLIHKPGAFHFNQMLSADKAGFAENLLKTVLEKKDFLKSFITPKLKNWDPDRIAMLDMILMEMGVSEFLFFETIPPKVTINEYIDLAKEYSTQQSGQFVNGILDNIHKELVQQGKMKKVDFKKV